MRTIHHGREFRDRRWSRFASWDSLGLALVIMSVVAMIGIYHSDLPRSWGQVLFIEAAIVLVLGAMLHEGIPVFNMRKWENLPRWQVFVTTVVLSYFLALTIFLFVAATFNGWWLETWGPSLANAIR